MVPSARASRIEFRSRGYAQFPATRGERIGAVSEDHDRVPRDLDYEKSLSQFNRAFARFTGSWPSNFRREELSRTAN